MIKRNGNLKFKKGNAILDSLMILIVLVVFAMFSLVAFKLLNIVNDDVQLDDDLINETKDTINDATTYYPTLFDTSFIVILVLMWGLILVASFMIDSHPIFFIFSVVILVGVLIAAGYLSNGYQEIVADDEFSTLSASFPMTNFIISHLIETILAIAFSVILVLFGKGNY